MVLNTLIQFPIFAPPNPPHNHRLSTEIRFSRWNNANAEKFIRRERTQKEIEDQLRFLKRFNSAHKITTIYNPAPPTPVTGNPAADIYKSTGTPSSPSRRSIPGKASKYSKPPRNASDSHPAFRPIVKPRPIPTEAEKPEPEVKVTEKGVVYELPDAPFVYQYSYTETPKVKPVKLREPAIAPFGPSTMPRPWTGRKPLPPSKKKLQFDSFQLPPPHKKGVKPVQAPGPFLPGSGPKYVQSREEILGEPLTKEEIEELVRSCIKSKRQLNMGRDGLTHNMLDNIHSHWKRRRVCKIRCKGVCTVDLDNVKQQLEEKTGGKIIYSKGGVMYLFRGRNYNYRTRPRFPIMLWKPVTPVYPRLIKRVPEGLTLEEATEMREKGRKLSPICKLAKNGVYYNLVKDVQEAFEACELVRIDCQGVNASDYRKIGAKLQDLVPCVLISFEQEHILMWRGRDWKSSLPGLGDDLKYTENFAANGVPLSVCQSESTPKSCVPNSSVGNAKLNNLNTSDSPLDREYTGSEGVDHSSEVGDENLLSEGIASDTVSDITDFSKNENEVSYVESTTDGMEALTEKISSKMILDGSLLDHNNEEVATIVESEVISRCSDNSKNLSEPLSLVPLTCDKQSHLSGNASNVSEPVNLSSTSTKVLQLWRQAVESGNAIVLEDSNLDADIVYERAIACAQSAPPQPVFRHGSKKKAVQKSEEATKDSEVKEIANIPNKRGHGTKSFKRLKDLNEDNLNVLPQGSLRVDELAKLLA